MLLTIANEMKGDSKWGSIRDGRRRLRSAGRRAVCVGSRDRWVWVENVKLNATIGGPSRRRSVWNDGVRTAVSVCFDASGIHAMPSEPNRYRLSATLREFDILFVIAD